MVLSNFTWIVINTVLVLAAYAVVKRCVQCKVYVMPNQQCVSWQCCTGHIAYTSYSSTGLDCECIMCNGSCRLIGALVSSLVRSSSFKLTVTSVGLLIIKGISLQLSKVPPCAIL